MLKFSKLSKQEAYTIKGIIQYNIKQIKNFRKNLATTFNNNNYYLIASFIASLYITVHPSHFYMHLCPRKITHM